MALAGIAVLIGGIWLYAHVRADAQARLSNAAQSQAARAIPVVAATARRDELPIYLDALGSVTPLNFVTIHTRVDGQIETIAFTEGKLVHQGDLLAQIDPRPFQVQLEQAQGQSAKDVAALKDARLQLERDKLAGDSISKQQVDTQAATVDEDQAAIKIDQAQIDTAKLQLDYCRITAPITGVIGLRLVDEGNIIHATDANGLAVITQIQPITVVFSISEDQLPPVLKQKSSGGRLVVDSYDRSLSNKLASGFLAAVDNQIDATTGMVKLKAQFANEDSALFPNQFVNVRLLIDTIKDAVIVPAAAVQRGPDSVFVYVVKSDQTVEVRDVAVGPTEGDKTVIRSGLSAGEVVVTDGVDKLQVGSKVQIRQKPATRQSTTAPTTRSAKPATEADR